MATKIKTISYVGGYFCGAIHRLEKPLTRHQVSQCFKVETITPKMVEYLYVFDRFIGDRGIMVCRGQRMKASK